MGNIAITTESGVKTLPMLPVARPVNPKWECQRSGDCCKGVPEVIMTKQEAAVVVHHAPKEITLHFRPLDEKFVAMKAGPCPLFAFRTCLIYENRPYNCRRWGCMRPDVKAEPFEPNGNNMYDRVKTSRVARRMAILMQRHAQRWARKHGWSDADK